LALVAAAGLASLVLTACGDGPVRSGAAATVGDKRITTQELAGFIERGLADPQAQQQLGADKPAFQRQTLSRLINHEVLAEAVRRRGISVLPGAIDARLAEFEAQAGGPEMLIQQAAQNGIAEQDLRRFINDLVLNDTLGDQLTKDIEVPREQLTTLFAQNAAMNDQVKTAHILVPQQAQAESILKQVKADPSTFAALAAQFSTDPSNKDKGGDLGFAGRGQFVKPFEDAAFAGKTGDIVIAKTEFGFHVIRILERRTTTLEQATPLLRRTVLQQQREQAIAELLTEVANDLGVTVNPRYGRWNAAMGAVEEIPNGSGVSSPAPARGDGELLGDPQQLPPGVQQPPPDGQQPPPDGQQPPPDGQQPPPDGQQPPPDGQQPPPVQQPAPQAP